MYENDVSVNITPHDCLFYAKRNSLSRLFCFQLLVKYIELKRKTIQKYNNLHSIFPILYIIKALYYKFYRYLTIEKNRNKMKKIKNQKKVKIKREIAFITFSEIAILIEIVSWFFPFLLYNNHNINEAAVEVPHLCRGFYLLATEDTDVGRGLTV